MAEVDTNTDGPGNLLSAARKKAGLSKSDIADQLNLSVAVIEQLESDLHSDDIPDAFLRGYLRTYARAVGQDEEHIIALYSQVIGSSIVCNHYVPSADVPPVKIQIGSHMLWFKLISVVVIIAILVLGWLAYSQRNISEEEETSNVETVQPSEQSNVEADNTATEQPMESLAEEITEDEPLSDLSDDIESVTVTDVTAEPEEIPQGFVETATLTDAELDFTFIDDCWIQVTDSNEEVLAVGLKNAGRRFTVSGVPPIQVVLGKPRAISLQYNNQSVDLSIYPAGQTARFSLGEKVLDKKALGED